MWYNKDTKRKGGVVMARAKRTKWDKNLASVIQARNAAIVRINELRDAGWNFSDDVMRRVTAPLAKRYTAEQARKAKQMFSLNRINFAATKQIGSVKIRKTQRFDWDKNEDSFIQAQNDAIIRINELREAGWNVSDDVMKRVTAPLAKMYTAEQARKAKQMFSLNRINFEATKQVGPVTIRKTQRFDDPYMAAIDKLLTKPEGALKLSEAIVKDVKHTLDPLKGSPSRSKAAFWVEMLSDLQNQSGIQLIPKKEKSELIKDAYMIDVSPAKLKQAIEKSAWSFREVGEGVYKYMPDIRGDKQEQIARSKQTFRKKLHASARSVEALFEFFEYSIWWNNLKSKQRHAVSEQIISTMTRYDEAANKIDFAELDRRLLQGGDPVEVVEQYVRELIGDEL